MNMQENFNDELEYRIIETENVNNNQEDNKMGEKKLVKSADRKICGVCGGIGEYLGIDPTVIRLLWVVFTFMGGAGLLAYIVAAIIVPEM